MVKKDKIMANVGIVMSIGGAFLFGISAKYVVNFSPMNIIAYISSILMLALGIKFVLDYGKLFQ